ncbi:MAG: NusG domain II-containing protein [Thiobacillaceae bacterium]
MHTLLRPGDWLILLLGCATVASLATIFWSGTAGDTLIIRAGGKIHDQASLRRTQTFSVQGPLGVTLIEIQPGRARIARDPSPRQLCVKQGWLSHAGEAALCLPNQVSVEIQGAVRAHDSVAY